MSKAWMDAAADKYRRGRRLLFNRDSECLQELLALIRRQKHRTLVLWALEGAQAIQRQLARTYPAEERPRRAVELCRAWAEGTLKMPEAKRALLDAHAAAKTALTSADEALFHAVGQACATVHVETHAIGLAIYELSALVFAWGPEAAEAPVEAKISCYIDRLRYWEAQADAQPRRWARFLLDDSQPNKEQILFEKQRRDASNTTGPAAGCISF